MAKAPDDRESRLLRRAMLREEEEMRRQVEEERLIQLHRHAYTGDQRIAEEQRLIQAQREEYLRDQKRRRDEANRRDKLIEEQRIADEQHVLQARREEYLRDQRRRRDEANQRDKYIEKQRIADEQRLIQVQREGYLREQRIRRDEAYQREKYLIGLKSEEKDTLKRLTREERQAAHAYKDEEGRNVLQIQREQLAFEERMRKAEGLIQAGKIRDKEGGYLRGQSTRSEALAYKQSEKHKHEFPSDFEKEDDQESLYETVETTDDEKSEQSDDSKEEVIFDKISDSLAQKIEGNVDRRHSPSAVSSYTRRSLNNSMRDHPVTNQRKESDANKIDADRNRTSEAHMDVNTEPFDTIEEEIAALDRRLTLLAETSLKNSPRELDVDNKLSTLEDIQAQYEKKHATDTTQKKQFERHPEKQLRQDRTSGQRLDRKTVSKLRGQEATPMTDADILEREFLPESDKIGRHMPGYRSDPTGKTMPYSRAERGNIELMFDGPSGYETTPLLTSGQRLDKKTVSKLRGQDATPLADATIVEREFLPETNIIGRQTPGYRSDPTGNTRPYSRTERGNRELMFEGPSGYESTPLLDYAFSQGYKKALEETDYKPWIPRDVSMSHDYVDYTRPLQRDEILKGRSFRYLYGQSRQDERNSEYTRTNLAENVQESYKYGLDTQKNDSILKERRTKEEMLKTKDSILEERRMKEEILKAKEEELNKAELELNKKECWIQHQEHSRAKEAKSDAYEEELTEREKELTLKYEKMQARKTELQKREAALLQKQHSMTETSKHSDLPANRETRLENPSGEEIKAAAEQSANTTNSQTRKEKPVETKTIGLQTKAIMTESEARIATKTTSSEQLPFPKITSFSGEEPKSKTEASFEEWKYEVNCLRQDSSYTESQIAQAIRKSLRAQAKRVLLPLGTTALVTEIMSKLEGVFGNVATGESILAEFYTATQNQEESVAAWGLRLEEILQKAIEKGQVKQEEKNDMLREKFWRALRSDRLKNATRVHFESVTNFELLRRAVRAEEHEMKLYTGIKQQQLKVQNTSSDDKAEDLKYEQLITRIASLEKQLKYNRRPRRKWDKPKDEEQGKTVEKEDQKQNLNC